MLFNSLIFIGVFLPVSLIGWYGLQKFANPLPAKLFIIVASLVFYGYYNPSFLWILGGSVIFNFACSRLITYLQKGGNIHSLIYEKRQELCKWILVLGILVNVGSLFYYKYYNFFLENCNFLLHTDLQIEKIALPLGISFFTFHQISYLVDRYRGATGEAFVDYAFFITFFPQIISGPIVRHEEFMPQLLARKNRTLDTGLFFDGLCLFILGLAKKVLLADVLAIVVNAEYPGVAYLDGLSAWAVIIFYMLELYFDFSGYSDMTRGISKMFGFILPENFNAPFAAASIKDFWRRWHMTLSRFLTTYIYIPLGGNRKGTARKCLNLMLVFLVSGFWHGANWTFVVWGLMHGVAMVWENLFPKLRFRSEKLNRLLTAVYVTLSFSIFRCDSLAQAGILWKQLFTGGINKFFLGMSNVLQVPEMYVVREVLERVFPAGMNLFYVGCMLLLTGASVFVVCGPKAEDWIEKHGRKKWALFLLAILFGWSLISLSQVSSFLYFEF